MDRPRYVRRFSRTERALHWVHASAFLVLLGSGLVLYLPSLSEWVGQRPVVKAVHIDTAIVWVLALALVVLVGDRRGLRKTLGELDRFDADDRLWLKRVPAPQGRFNAGQKISAALTAAFAVLFAASGFLLWLGEGDARFRFGSTIILHDGLMWISLVLLVGHLHLAVLNPATRHSLRGMTRGSVKASWAARHHRKWLSSSEAEYTDR
jgi:formate dehydrogenase subunit gamma